MSWASRTSAWQRLRYLDGSGEWFDLVQRLKDCDGHDYRKRHPENNSQRSLHVLCIAPIRYDSHDWSWPALAESF